MPVVSLIEEDVLQLQLQGHFTMEEVKHAFSEAIAKLAAGNKPSLLIDIQTSKELKSMQELQDAASYFAQHFDHIRPVVSLCIADKTRFGIGKQFCAFAELSGFESAGCFYSCEDCRKFLQEKI